MIVGQKLVRDKIPDSPCALPDGCTVEFDELSPVSMPSALVDKIIEEARELGNTLMLKNGEDPESTGFIEKAADVLEALSELIRRKGIPFDVVNKALAKKRKEMGGFVKGIWRTIRKEDEDENR